MLDSRKQTASSMPRRQESSVENTIAQSNIPTGAFNAEGDAETQSKNLAQPSAAVLSNNNNLVRNVVTVYNQETFEIGKIRVNRVITIRSLMQKIGAYFGVPDGIKDLVIRFGDLNLAFEGCDQGNP